MRNILTSQLRETLKPIFSIDKKYEMVFNRLTIPDQVHEWKINWEDDHGNLRTNTGFRVQHNNLLGPYKGGLRFHADVSRDVFESLALEQSFKNSLTGRPLGGAKGGSDFDSTLHSDRELRSFCKGYVTGLKHIIGTNLDVPAGDIGVNEKTIGMLYGEFVRQCGNVHDPGAFTGKPGACEYRPVSTGYGVSYLADYHCQHIFSGGIKGKSVIMSGNGNVGFHTGVSLINKGARLHTVSSIRGTCYSEKGFTFEEFIQTNHFLNRVENELPSGVTYFKGQKPWEIIPKNIEVDLAIPCSLQNEINHKDVQKLHASGCKSIVEGANLACTNDATELIQSYKISHVGGKLANIGGVVCSHEEMLGNTAFDVCESNVLDTLKGAYDASTRTMDEYGLPHIMAGATTFAFLRLFNRAQELGRI